MSKTIKNKRTKRKEINRKKEKLKKVLETYEKVSICDFC